MAHDARLRNLQMNAISPMQVFMLVLAIVFAVETGIMLTFAAVPPRYRDDFWLSLIDSATLVIVLCPAFWLLIVKPLRALVSERGALLSRSMEIQEQERARLSRDLHDELGQIQTAVLLALRGVLNSTTHAEAVERATAAHQIALSAVDSTRRIARGLSPTVLRDFGLGEAIGRVCEDLAAASGIEIERHLELGNARLESAVEIAAYRLVQEAITNAAKHSAAAKVRVNVELSDGGLSVTIADDGRGLPPEPSASADSSVSLGLAGMRERVVLLGGEFSIASTPAAGTTLRATIPVHPDQS